MRSPGINGEGELRGQPANPGSPRKMTVKTECVCVCVHIWQETNTYQKKTDRRTETYFAQSYAQNY